MQAAFRNACEAPQVKGAGHYWTELVAEKILKLGEAGETDPERLCSAVADLNSERNRDLLGQLRISA